MNNRIKELAKEAYIAEARSTVPGWKFNEFSAALLSDLEGFSQKFAELIILECASICYKSSFDDSDAHAMNLLYEFNIDGVREWK